MLGLRYQEGVTFKMKLNEVAGFRQSKGKGIGEKIHGRGKDKIWTSISPSLEHRVQQ
jgi:hypothetical protein